MKVINLGFEAPDYSKMHGCCAPESSAEDKKTPTKTVYPSMSIPGNKALARALKPGQKFTATVTFVVAEVAIRDRKGDSEDGPVDIYGGTRVELEAESMSVEGVKVEDAEEEVSGAEAIAKYFSSSKK